MAGHSKWANIKHRKGAQDAKRGKIFTKLIREITIAAKMSGAEIGSNPRLRAVVDKALNANMTRDTIDRAIKRGAGGLEGADLAEVRYEGYGQGGVAVMVDCLTDNRNRTVSEVRHAFTKYGGNLGTDGSVAYLFSNIGQIVFPQTTDENALMEIGLELGAEDVSQESTGEFVVTTDPTQFNMILDALKEKGFQAIHAEVTMVPATYVNVDGETAEGLMKMIDVLEDLDDVQNVYTNADFPDELMNQ
ncbi:MAG: YebC/PmpR family DNA-binding transcriptional regulator [Gammaproteobacteria bacterium]